MYCAIQDLWDGCSLFVTSSCEVATHPMLHIRVHHQFCLFPCTSPSLWSFHLFYLDRPSSTFHLPPCALPSPSLCPPSSPPSPFHLPLLISLPPTFLHSKFTTPGLPPIVTPHVTSDCPPLSYCLLRHCFHSLFTSSTPLPLLCDPIQGVLCVFNCFNGWCVFYSFFFQVHTNICIFGMFTVTCIHSFAFHATSLQYFSPYRPCHILQLKTSSSSPLPWEWHRIWESYTIKIQS